MNQETSRDREVVGSSLPRGESFSELFLIFLVLFVYFYTTPGPQVMRVPLVRIPLMRIIKMSAFI